MARKHRTRPRPPTFVGAPGLLDVRPVAMIDLHGDDALTAERRVRGFLQGHAQRSRGLVLHIVTGRGTGSKHGPVLRARIKRLLGGDLARFVQEYDLDIDDGGWLVRLR